MRPDLKLTKRLTAAQLNGVTVALGVALVQGLVGQGFGGEAGLLAAGGAVCAALPDVPNAPHRAWPRMLPAALATALVTLAVGLLRTQAVAMTLLVAVIGFTSLMTMAWGKRAGPLSFAPVLALVFAMARGPVPANAAEAIVHAGWALAGALAYAGWGRAMASVLQTRYIELEVAAALRASAQRLRSRAKRVSGEVPAAGDSIRKSIVDDVQLADALQAARDLAFAAQASAQARRHVDVVLGLIELRDLLLASRLDVPLLGDDATAWGWRRALADSLLRLAQQLDELARGVGQGEPVPPLSAADCRHVLASRLLSVGAAEGDPRKHLVAALESRMGHMFDDVANMTERCNGPDRESVWSPAQLQLFVSPEGWPLAALRPHLSLQSGVLRHALRGMLAMALAYALGLWLPWASHPAWLVLSVAVVLRGSLDQTLARRNERIIGTVLGCLLVLGLAYLGQRGLLIVSFMASVGVSHAYVNVRYRVAATAATLMALLQPLLLTPGAGPAVYERLADTFIGAMLAWAFCFVLPSWERRSLARLGEQLRRALARHAANVLAWSPSAERQLAQRLSRQQAYAALAALAGAGQRTLAEPSHVRLPDREVEALLSRGYRLMALLGIVQQLLGRRQSRLDGEQALPALSEAAQACQQALHRAPEVGAEPVPPDAGVQHDPVEASAGDIWPVFRGEGDLTPWLLRRLRLCQVEAVALQRAEAALLAAVRRSPA
ncbi:FUSC family protein [Aquabacterium sp.]|uniref:FUSC family protein n=1 Tax=Aquabacterium sp. TaxID=1872578 RepID=UPI0035AFC238